MMKRSFGSLLLLLLILPIALAHEFWLQPAKFFYKVGEEMKVDLMNGENFDGTFWETDLQQVAKLEWHTTGNPVRNLIKEVKPTKGSNLKIKFDKEGTHLLGFETKGSVDEMSREEFNEYRKERDEEEISGSRLGADGSSVKEYQQRFAKLLVQCGVKVDEMHRKRMNFRYEIMPLTNPYLLKSGEYLECRLLWEGKPAPHALVKVWSHVGNRTFLQNIFTEDDGTIKFPLSSKGAWMVSSVKMQPSTNPQADYETTTTSLVFGIQ